MYDFLDKIGLKAVLEAIKGKMPTSLPANGGNADTVGLRYSNDFLGKDYVYPPFANYGYGADLNNYVAEYHGFIYNCDNSPIAYDYGFLDVSFFDGTGFLPSTPDKGGVVLQKFSRIDNRVFTRMRYANVWSEWKEISTTPIKSTTVNGSTDSYGSLLLWSISGSIPIAAVGDENRIFSPFIGSGNNYYLAVRDLAGNVIANTTASATVFYI